MTNNNGLSLESMDLTVNANENFGQFANGKWAGLNPIPEAYGNWGVFMMLRDKVLSDLHQLCQSSSVVTSDKSRTSSGEEEKNVTEKTDDDDADEMSRKIGWFWKHAMDENTIETLGIRPLETLLALVDKVTSVADFVKTIGRLHASGITVLFDADIVPDLKESSMERLFVGQGGLGLPDQEYYLEDEKAKIREAYVIHVGKMLRLAKVALTEEEGDSMAQSILKLETGLAKKSKTRTEMRDLMALYNPETPEMLERHGWMWTSYFETLGFHLSEAKHIVNSTPLFFDYLAEEITQERLPEWKTYTKWHLVRSMSSYLSSDFVNESFNLSKLMSGAKELEPRWKRVLSALNSHAGELLGQVYCEKHFTSESKTKCMEMIQNLRKSLSETIKSLEWMGPETKIKALEKLDAMGVKIGFPDEWIDYSTLMFDAQSNYAENMLRAKVFEHRRNMNRVNKPVEKLRWEMAPQVVNAYYHPMRNEIVFPAAILQAPAFDANFDSALNYGAIGAVIGHEMTHGFDDQGRLFDAQGNMKEWWQKEDSDKFNALAKTCVDQYSDYEIFGRKVNGDLCQGENIADIGGVKIAYRAHEMHIAENKCEKSTQEDVKLQGYTSKQRFFIAWGQFWASNVREEQAHKLLAIDPHAPSELRAYCPLKNVEEFYTAFDVEPGHGMYLQPQDRVTIWG